MLTRHPVQLDLCTKCGTPFDQLEGNLGRKPEPGDLVVCQGCASTTVIQEDGTRRPASFLDLIGLSDRDLFDYLNNVESILTSTSTTNERLPSC